MTTAQTNTAAATNTVSFGAPNLYGALTGNADTATTATRANAGDSATSFFSSGQIERARGGTGADTSAYGAGLFGSDGSNNTIDVDSESELETAIGSVDIVTVTTDDITSANLRTILSDENGTGVAVFAGGDVGAATATTPAENDNDTSVATTAYVQTEIATLATTSAVTDTTNSLNTALTNKIWNPFYFAAGGAANKVPQVTGTTPNFTWQNSFGFGGTNATLVLGRP